jgi:hypothetical protein
MTRLTPRSALLFQQEPHQPLYQRAPGRDAEGRALGDFMVLIPGLRSRPLDELSERVASLQAVLLRFQEVVFVDLNLPLNLLWVSLYPRQGVVLELFGAMRVYLPEAKLIGHRWE